MGIQNTCKSHPEYAQLLEDCLCLATLRTSRRITQQYDEMLGPVSLTGPQFTLLAHVKLKPCITLSALAGRLAVDRTTLTRNLQLLQKRLLVEVRESACDGLQREVELSAAGQEMMASAFPLWRLAQSVSTQCIGVNHVERLLSIARDITFATPAEPRGQRRPSNSRAAEYGCMNEADFAYLKSNLCICTTVRQLARHVTRLYAWSFKHTGITIQQFHMLCMIAGTGVTRQKDIVERLGLDQTTCSRNLQVAARTGLVKRLVDGVTHHQIHVTAKGHAALVAAIPSWNEAQEQLTVELGDLKPSKFIEIMSVVPTY